MMVNVLQARVSREVEVALEQVAEDFLAKTLELGAAIARRRASEFLTPADLNVALERLWCGFVYWLFRAAHASYGAMGATRTGFCSNCWLTHARVRHAAAVAMAVVTAPIG